MPIRGRYDHVGRDPDPKHEMAAGLPQLAGKKIVGGHAVAAVGFDDGLKIRNNPPGAAETTGTLLIRNSWGTGWGAAGYGWLPYAYVTNHLADDWWALLKQSWIDTGNFG
ncbi:MAG: C1 family peptidase [Nitrosomonadaceae bacterium]|nr:C1 family peptidase [Nitrosomonadaceae bacterium]